MLPGIDSLSSEDPRGKNYNIVTFNQNEIPFMKLQLKKMVAANCLTISKTIVFSATC